jgi:hypothetical protein
MTKTKRRSCKGGRKSRRCRGGLPKRAYGDSYYANGKKAESGFRLAEPTLNLFSMTPPSTADIVNKVERDAKNYMRMRRLRELARGFRASTASAARRLRDSTASAARGLKDSVLGLPSKFRNSRIGATAFNAVGLRSGYIDHSQLVPVDETIQQKYGPDDLNASDKLYACDENGYLYEAALDNLNPDGYLPDRSNPLTAMFLPGRGPKPGQSWRITYRRR